VLFADGIKATSVLDSIEIKTGWSQRFVDEILLPAMEVNRSITICTLCYYNDYGRGTTNAVERILERNKVIHSSNAAMAVSMSLAGDLRGGCPQALIKTVLKQELLIQTAYLDPAGDRCFCSICFAESGDNLVYLRGEPARPYILPVGYFRFGLKVLPGLIAEHDPFKNWHNAYHGTDISGMKKIFSSGLRLLKPGDIGFGGGELGVKNGHIPKPFTRINRFNSREELFDPNQIFTSPSIRYSGHPVYAPAHIIDHPTLEGKRLLISIGFQLSQRPGSYQIGQETVAAKEQLDPLISNDELEYYTKEGVGIVIRGLLVKVSVK
jgi:E3 ubiquitin-protein ligase mind-bomb